MLKKVFASLLSGTLLLHNFASVSSVNSLGQAWIYKETQKWEVFLLTVVCRLPNYQQQWWWCLTGFTVIVGLDGCWLCDHSHRVRGPAQVLHSIFLFIKTEKRICLFLQSMKCSASLLSAWVLLCSQHKLLPWAAVVCLLKHRDRDEAAKNCYSWGQILYFCMQAQTWLTSVSYRCN